MSNPIPAGLRLEVYERDNYTCQFGGCNLTAPGNRSIQHRIKRSQGGKHVPENLVTICWQPHHHYLEHNPAKAELAGFYVRRELFGNDAHIWLPKLPYKRFDGAYIQLLKDGSKREVDFDLTAALNAAYPVAQ